MRSTVMALSNATRPCSSFSRRRRVVGVGSGAEAEACVLNRPDMPKWTCTTWSSASEEARASLSKK